MQTKCINQFLDVFIYAENNLFIYFRSP